MSSKTEEDEDFNWEDDSEDEEDEEGDDDDDDTDADEKGCRPSNDDVQSNNSDVTDASLATVTRRCGQLGILDEAFEKVFFLYIRLSRISYLDNNFFHNTASSIHYLKTVNDSRKAMVWASGQPIGAVSLS